MCELNKTCLLVFVAITNLYLFGMGIGSIVVGMKINQFANDKETYLLYMSRFPTSKTEDAKETVEEKSVFERGGMMFLVLGAILIGFSIMGSLIIIFRRKGLIIAYLVILCLVMFAETAVCAMGFIFTRNLENGLEIFLTYTLKTHYTGPYLDIQLDYYSMDKELQDLVTQSANKTVNDTNSQGQSAVDAAEKFLSANQAIVVQYVKDYLYNATAVTTLEKMSLAWDRTMLSLDCCGNKNYSNFYDISGNWNGRLFFTVINSPYNNIVPYSYKMLVPPTCCLQDESSDPPDVVFHDIEKCLTSVSEDATQHKGCYSEIKSLILKLVGALTFLALTLVIIEIFGVVNACFVWKAITAEEEDAKFELYGSARVAKPHIKDADTGSVTENLRESEA